MKVRDFYVMTDAQREVTAILKREVRAVEEGHIELNCQIGHNPCAILEIKLKIAKSQCKGDELTFRKLALLGVSKIFASDPSPKNVAITRRRMFWLVMYEYRSFNPNWRNWVAFGRKLHGLLCKTVAVHEADNALQDLGDLIQEIAEYIDGF